jgi:2-polyprenyl-3-methyl-5-hydroxy-6-metoxy-1,4-benzoquinol methylase
MKALVQCISDGKILRNKLGLYDPMTYVCKICQRPVKPLYTIGEITYYHCRTCNFLQNYYWEDHPENDLTEQEQIATNDEARERLWPAGERDHMHQKGWEILELMTSPIAWASRHVHTQLKKIPSYTNWTKKQAKAKQPKLLDFGCGHGVMALELHHRDGFDIVGLDPFSPVEHPRIMRSELLATKFPDQSFSGIMTLETMEHISNVLEVYSELQRILKPGGVLLVQTRRLEDPNYIAQRENWFYLQEPETHVAIYSEPAMQTIAQKTGFSTVSFRGAKYAKFVK